MIRSIFHKPVHAFFQRFFQSACCSVLLLVLCALGGCAGHGSMAVKEDVSAVTARSEIPENQLLNVTIQVFDPGELPEDEEERAGLSQEIREAEAIFLPVQLKDTLQNTGYWGSVWVVPRQDPQNGAGEGSEEREENLPSGGDDDQEQAELNITGRIEYSDGEKLVLTIVARDATNRVWLDKTYSEEAEPEDRQGIKPEKKDVFQDMFNAIANDLIKFRHQLSPEEIDRIRKISELRYAASMEKDVFSRYYRQDEDGIYHLVSLPAEDDPMLARIRAIRARDEMLMDTLSSYYDNSYARLWTPYQNWRKNRSEELRAIRKIKDEAFTRQVMGFAAIAGAVALGAIGGEDASRILAPVRGIMAAGGAAAVYSGYEKRKEAEMNVEVLKELGESFAADATPLVVEVHGETVRLTGTAREQYAEWRRLLRKIYHEERGAVDDLPLILGPEINADHAGMDDNASQVNTLSDHAVDQSY